jgi:O-antigen ligase
LNTLLAGLLAASIVLIQCLTGGTRLVLALPAYALITLTTLLATFAFKSATRRPSGSCVVATALFFAYMLTRALNSPWDYLWWQDFYEMLGCLMVYGLCTCYVTTASSRTIIVGALLALSVAEFFIGLRQFRYVDNWMPFGFIRAGGEWRASGTLVSSIHYAGFLEAMGAFAMATAFWSRWPGWVRFLSGYAALMCYGGVAISGSRGGYLSTLVSLAAFAVLSLIAVRRLEPERLGRVLTYVAVSLVVAVVGAVFLMQQSPLLQKRLNLLAQQDLRIMSLVLSDGTREGAARPNADVRIYNWQAALDQIRVSPVVGTGAGTHLYFGRLFRRPQIQSDPIHAHSDYLEIVAEYGIIGAAGMLIFIVVHLRHGWRRFGHILEAELGDLDIYQPLRSDNLALVIGALSAVAAYLAHSIVDFNLHIPGNALTFAFIFAVLAAPRADEDPAPTAVEPAVRFALPGLAVWMAISGLGKWPGEYWWEKARVALRDQRFTESITFGQRAASYQQRNAELWFHLGEANRVKGASARSKVDRVPYLNAAVTAYERALQIFPLDEHVLVRLGQTLDELGRFAEARTAYRRALDHDPKLGVLHAYYAQHLFRVGRAEEAHAAFAEARQLGAENLQKIVDQSFIDVPVEPDVPEAAPQ